MLYTFKALSALLSYPTEDIRAAADELQKKLHDEAILPLWALRQIDELIGEYRTLDLYELQERYVFLFDRTRSLSLHLFEHVHGESRDRGQASFWRRDLLRRRASYCLNRLASLRQSKSGLESGELPMSRCFGLSRR